MADRPRHQRKEFEALLREAERRGWRIFRYNRYFRCYCPCPDEHQFPVVLTPSSSRTLINTRKRFERTPCWER